MTRGQSYKHFTLVNYDCRVVITSKLFILTTLVRVENYECRCFIRLATGGGFFSSVTYLVAIRKGKIL